MLLVVIVLMAAILIERLFYLQIIQGESYQENFSLSIKKERTLKSSRGKYLRPERKSDRIQRAFLLCHLRGQ